MARSDHTHKMVDGVRVDLTEAEIDAAVAAEEAHAAQKPAREWAKLRRQRNAKLAQSDWMANSDVTMSADWKRYREELRQLPASYNDTTVQGTITWPDEPVE